MFPAMLSISGAVREPSENVISRTLRLRCGNHDRLLVAMQLRASRPLT
jgi:hypothetical protein